MHQTWSGGERGGEGGERWAEWSWRGEQKDEMSSSQSSRYATALEHGRVYWGEGGRPHPHDMSMHQTWSGGERGGEGGERWSERALSAREPRGWSLAAHGRPTNLKLPPPQPPPLPLGDSFGLTLASSIERRPTLFRETQDNGLFEVHALSHPLRGSEYTDPLGRDLTSRTDSNARLPPPPPAPVMTDLSVAESRSLRTLRHIFLKKDSKQ